MRPHYAKMFSYVFVVIFIVTSLNIPYAAASSITVPAGKNPFHLSPSFIPAIARGMSIDLKDPFAFTFLIDRGDSPLGQEAKKESYNKLIKYFLAAMTVAEDKQWVNLSPYEKNRVIDNDFGKTEMGRDVLAQDYMLKQMTAALLHPEVETGRKFWNEVYAQAARQYGTTNIPFNAFNKIWITPDKASVYEKDNTVLIVESKLKVQCEEDYLASTKHREAGAPKTGPAQVAGRMLRDIVIPVLTKEVNEGKNFANLRQIFHGMILAAWYKQALKKSILTQVYANKNKVQGVNFINSDQDQQELYRQYIQAFKKGAYNFIREDQDPLTGKVIPRKYFSGGYASANLNQAMSTASIAEARHSFDAAARARLDAAQAVLKSANMDKAMSDSTTADFPVADWKEGDTVARKRDGQVGRITGAPSVRIGNRLRSVLLVRFPDALIQYFRDEAGQKLLFKSRAVVSPNAAQDEIQNRLSIPDMISRVIKDGNKDKKLRMKYEEIILERLGEAITTAEEFRNAVFILLTFPSALVDEDFKKHLAGEKKGHFIAQIIDLIVEYDIHMDLLPVMEELIKNKRLSQKIGNKEGGINERVVKMIKANMPVIIEPFASLADIVKIQKLVGDFEMNIEVIGRKDGKSWIFLSKEGTHVAQSRFGAMDFGSNGHTHAFYELPLQQSNEDNAFAMGLNQTSFILGFDKNTGAVELAYYTPATKQWAYIQDHSPRGQTAITQKLQEFGLIVDKAMIKNEIAQLRRKIAHILDGNFSNADKAMNITSDMHQLSKLFANRGIINRVFEPGIFEGLSVPDDSDELKIVQARLEDALTVLKGLIGARKLSRDIMYQFEQDNPGKGPGSIVGELADNAHADWLGEERRKFGFVEYTPEVHALLIHAATIGALRDVNGNLISLSEFRNPKKKFKLSGYNFDARAFADQSEWKEFSDDLKKATQSDLGSGVQINTIAADWQILTHLESDEQWQRERAEYVYRLQADSIGGVIAALNDVKVTQRLVLGVNDRDKTVQAIVDVLRSINTAWRLNNSWQWKDFYRADSLLSKPFGLEKDGGIGFDVIRKDLIVLQSTLAVFHQRIKDMVIDPKMKEMLLKAYENGLLDIINDLATNDDALTEAIKINTQSPEYQLGSIMKEFNMQDAAMGNNQADKAMVFDKGGILALLRSRLAKEGDVEIVIELHYPYTDLPVFIREKLSVLINNFSANNKLIVNVPIPGSNQRYIVVTFDDYRRDEKEITPTVYIEEVNLLPPDAAMLNNKKAVTPTGGIDFNPNGFQLKRDGQGMPLPLFNQDPAMLNIQGLEPRIIEIKSAANLPIFSHLGLQ